VAHQKWILLASIALIAPKVLAQGMVPQATVADSDFVAERAISKLFEGISLNSKQQALAKLMIKRAFVAQMTAISESQAAQQDPRSQVMKIHANRDSSLKALLPSAADKALFEKNAIALQNHTARAP
jgi:hypothetical protein